MLSLGRHHRCVRAGFVGLLFAVLSGCSSEPPGCADETTLSLAKETFWESVSRRAVDAKDKALFASVRPKFDVTLQTPRVTEKGGGAAKLLCAATLKVSLNAAESAAVSTMFKRENVSEVEYSSQLTADGKQHVVELAGQQNAVEYVWSLAHMGAFNPAPMVPSATAPTPASAGSSQPGQ